MPDPWDVAEQLGAFFRGWSLSFEAGGEDGPLVGDRRMGGGIFAGRVVDALVEGEWLGLVVIGDHLRRNVVAYIRLKEAQTFAAQATQVARTFYVGPSRITVAPPPRPADA
jgi:hypothetical protein